MTAQKKEYCGHRNALIGIAVIIIVITAVFLILVHFDAVKEEMHQQYLKTHCVYNFDGREIEMEDYYYGGYWWHYNVSNKCWKDYHYIAANNGTYRDVMVQPVETLNVGLVVVV